MKNQDEGAMYLRCIRILADFNQGTGIIGMNANVLPITVDTHLVWKITLKKSEDETKKAQKKRRKAR